jgi:hypothetical protein
VVIGAYVDYAADNSRRRINIAACGVVPEFYAIRRLEVEYPVCAASWWNITQSSAPRATPANIDAKNKMANNPIRIFLFNICK